MKDYDRVREAWADDEEREGRTIWRTALKCRSLLSGREKRNN